MSRGPGKVEQAILGILNGMGRTETYWMPLPALIRRLYGHRLRKNMPKNQYDAVRRAVRNLERQGRLITAKLPGGGKAAVLAITFPPELAYYPGTPLSDEDIRDMRRKQTAALIEAWKGKHVPPSVQAILTAHAMATA